MSHQPVKIPSLRWVRVVPLLIVLNTVAYVDRYNVGYAIAGGLGQDLGMSSSYAGFAAGIFFWGYLIPQFPGGHLAERGYAKIFITCALVLWSSLTICMGLVSSGPQFVVLRFFVGLAEGGVFPAVYTILGNWFPAKEAGRASALFITNTAFASLIAGPLSGLILGNLGWRALFVMEGAFSLMLVAVWVPLMSESPARASWLSREERDYIVAGQVSVDGDEKTAKLDWGALVRDRNLWLLSIIYLLYHVANGGYVVWLPTITKVITHTSIGVVGFLTVTPFVLSFVGLFVFGTLSDRSLNRRRYIVISMLSLSVSLAAAGLLGNKGWIAFIPLAASGLFLKPVIGLFWTLPNLVFGRRDIGAARGIINGIGNLGGFLGPTIVGVATTRTGDFSAGIIIIAGFLVGGALLTVFLPAITSGIRRLAGDGGTYRTPPGNLSSPKVDTPCGSGH